MDTFIGFDSAWTDKATAPGAICALTVSDGRPFQFHAPRLASFADALSFIAEVRSMDGATLLALDQPTVVPNLTSMRPVERAAASVVSWLGGGVQPANRSKLGMFCDASPIWPFLKALAALEDPEEARIAYSCLHLIEVFPALALPSLSSEFFGRLAAPRYNPARRKTFRLDDWKAVAITAAEQFDAFGAGECSEWCRVQAYATAPKKADQDRLDAMLCLIVALTWRLRPRPESIMLGSITDGYMIFPASPEVRERVLASANRYAVPAR